MTSVYDNLGPSFTVTDFAEDDLTPELEYYADKDDDGFEGTPANVLLPTREMNDNYVGVRVELPLGDGMAQSRVTKRALDNDGNPLGRANDKPIKNSREYTVEFEDGREADLAAHVIA